jgi:uncharacterized membrane-anchored protein
LRLRKKGDFVRGLYRYLSGVLKFWFMICVSAVILWAYHNIPNLVFVVVVVVGIGLIALYYYVKRNFVEFRSLKDGEKL